jgi:hypothetical protein
MQSFANFSYTQAVNADTNQLIGSDRKYLTPDLTPFKASVGIRLVPSPRMLRRMPIVAYHFLASSGIAASSPETASPHYEHARLFDAEPAGCL